MRLPVSGAAAPAARLISNGRYHVVLSAAGGGQSRCRGLALNRWSADRVEDGQGQFIYLRDLDTGDVWSAGLQPVPRRGASYDAEYECGRVSLRCAHGDIETRLDVAVAPGDDVEVRRLSLHNRSPRRRRLDVTSYVEVVLNHPAADAAHPAFSKLFVETELVPGRGALLARRRPRASDETWPWMLHALVGGADVQWETDRRRFIGRGRSSRRPAALTAHAALSGRVGPVLDPVFSLRATVDLAAGARTDVGFLTGMAMDRAAAIAMLERLRDHAAIEAVLADAAEAERALWERLGISEEQAAKYQALGGALWYAHPALRSPTARLGADVDVNATLERLGIPRDRPLIVAECAPDDPRLSEIMTARRYWDAKGLSTALVGELPAPTSATDRDAVRAAASLVLGDSWPAITEADNRVSSATVAPAPAVAPPSADVAASAPAAGTGLRFFNGHGGFSPDGSEYVIRLSMSGDAARPTPAPWINVVANERGGFLVSERGAGYTWSRNSQAHRLTPWSNDPVVDPSGEALYVRDDDTGALWSPLPAPAPAACLYEVRHGFGYSRVACTTAGLVHDTVMFVPERDPVRIIWLRLTNESDRRRRVSVVSYGRLVMAATADVPGAIMTAHDADHEILHAVNPRGNEFRDGIAFAAIVAGDDVDTRRFTCDRASFIGRNGTVGEPAALLPGAHLDGACGAGLDPCFAQQARVTLEPRQVVDIAFLLGECTEREAVRELVARYREPNAVPRALAAVQAEWRAFVSTISVETPVPALDVLLNGWLVYQALSCRILARSAFYQSGGAWGYRDQLQDVAALVHHRPALARAQILLHAAHQFVEGDVLHWWHPAPMERGLRTHFSDDLLWLPEVTSRYVRITGDDGVLDEVVPFLQARSLEPGEDETYLAPVVSDERVDVYEHCCRALDRSLTRGAHGLPLMGTGDWNDGMNRVGRQGRGESVWLGFFLVRVIDGFLPLCARRGDHARVARYSAYRADLAVALDDAGWDGAWYRRAYYDDGTPLGSHTGDECRIDAIAQAWSVISGVARPERAAQALDATEAMLVSERAGIIRLLTPPFVATAHDPGYIKGYVAGVRENGGQYTHGACWVVRAMAELGRRDRAAQLLSMLLPTSHALTPEAADRYTLEPYVVAADVYGEPPHEGRGGWSWYTGSAGWLYRVALETILGFTVQHGDTLRLHPRVPDNWPGYRITYRTGTGTIYEVEVTNPHGHAARVATVEVDGRPVTCGETGADVPIATDGRTHRVTVVLA